MNSTMKLLGNRVFDERTDRLLRYYEPSGGIFPPLRCRDLNVLKSILESEAWTTGGSYEFFCKRLHALNKERYAHAPITEHEARSFRGFLVNRWSDNLWHSKNKEWVYESRNSYWEVKIASECIRLQCIDPYIITQ